MRESKQLTYEKFESLEEMPLADRALVESARSAARGSFSPYSNFKVGAAARLRSGRIVVGANVESEVFPSGMCAERTLLFSAAATCGDDPLEALAITSLSTHEECYPCGACRQSLLDAERRQGSAIRIIMAGRDTATVVDSAAQLLPFAFNL